MILKKRFSDIPLRYRFFLSSVITLLVLTAVSSLSLFLIYQRARIHDSMDYAESIAVAIAENIAIRTAETEAVLLERIRSYSPFFRASVLSGDGSIRLGGYMEGRMAAEMASSLYYMQIPIRGIYVESITGASIGFDREGRLLSGERVFLKTIETQRDYIRAQWGAALWLPVPEQHGDVTVARAIHSTDTTTYVGLMAVLVDGSFFDTILSGMLPEPYGLVIAESGNIVHQRGPHSVRIGKHQQEQYLRRAFGSGNLSDGTDTIHYTTAMNYDGRWSVSVSISERELLQALRGARVVVVLVALSCFVVALLISFYQASGVTSGIATLTRSISEMLEGNLSAKAEVKGGGEVAELARDFNVLSGRLETMLIELSEERNRKQEAELRSLEAEYRNLQAQLNPHFLYNALETINGKARTEDMESVASLVSALGKLLRGALSLSSEFVTLRQELDYAESYLLFLKAAHREEISLDFDIDDSLEEVRVPKFLLQPLLENSIVHGFPGGIKDAHLVITVKRVVKGNIEVVVADNGIGISQDPMLLLTQDRVKRRGVGLANIHRRIQIRFGKDYGITLSSDSSSGTVVRVLLPDSSSGTTGEFGS
jgi:two-component system, sensor histidine kinase YesM